VDPHLIADRWLTQICGWPCFQVAETLDARGADAIAGTMVTAAAGGPGFFFAKRAMSTAGAGSPLLAAGFKLVDRAVVLRRDLQAPLPPPRAGIAVAQADESQHAAVQEIAARCFRHSRFHSDPLFPLATAHEIKRAWVESYCAGRRGDALYVAEADGKVVGFLAAIVQGSGVEARAVIDLVGVAPEQQGRGVGCSLVLEFIRQWQERTAALLVGTQTENTASLRLYESCGFGVVDTTAVFHAHMRDGVTISC
jgi:ribosomal protein S18 acetylase RimI-like enzyme